MMPSDLSETECTPNSETTSTSHNGITRPWILYRQEYRRMHPDELLWERRVDNVGDNKAQEVRLSNNEAAFEVRQTYRIRDFDSTRSDSTSDKKVMAASVYLKARVSMHLTSVALCHAVRSIIRYYPQQDLGGEAIAINWPFAVLVHHYEELKNYRSRCASLSLEDLCKREVDAVEHLDLLLEYLDRHIMPDVNAELARNEKGRTTWEGTWIKFKPGSLVYFKSTTGDDWCPAVIESVYGGTMRDSPEPWMVEYWSMVQGQKYLDRCSNEFSIDRFDGERDIEHHYVDMSKPVTDEIAKELVQQGKMYWELLKKQCKYYRGKTRRFPFNEIDGLVMADIQAYYQDHPAELPKLMRDLDLRRWQSDCACVVCKRRNSVPGVDKKPLFEECIDIYKERTEKLHDYQYFLCPKEVPVFYFKTRVWERVPIKNFSEPRFDSNMINNLVMEPRKVLSLKALAKSFDRRTKEGKEMLQPPWSADFVHGKGRGLIFLLHGKPGVGKTCTAECIAGFIGRPLMVLTSSDIGVDPGEVERSLTKRFEIAMSWNAVLLIDEADVFMERRSSSDLSRNSLVAAFLRALEFYEGILFLTTNRVGYFDDAFISRIHVQIFYPDFTDQERQQVWKTFMEKLATERGDYIRLTLDAKEYIEGDAIKAVKWNGREIRNAIQTAVALAEYDDKKGSDGRIMVTDEHLKAVVALSKDFKDYLKTLHKGDEDKRAERRFER